MARYRETPKCPHCGMIIAKAVYRNQSGIPLTNRLIGDTFIRWEYKQHSCKEKQEFDKKMSESIDESISEMKKKGTLPPFFKQ